MTDGQRAGQVLHHLGLGEVVAHIAEAPGRVEALFGIVADDAPGLLAAMLQGVKPEGHEVRGIGNADNAEDTAFFLQLVAVGQGVEWM